MAVDNRDFADHFELDGSNVYVEDKRMGELKDATAKTASQVSITDQYVPLQDTDGNIVKISPASFQEALRVELGKLLANNDKGTTISGVPALSGSGNSLDFGSITPANLASVLGVGKAQFSYVTDINQRGNYIFYGSSGIDNVDWGTAVCFKANTGNSALQIFAPYNFSRIFVRVYNGISWSSWAEK